MPRAIDRSIIVDAHRLRGALPSHLIRPVVGLSVRRREGPQRRKPGLQIWTLHLKDRLRLAQAAEPIGPEAAEAYAGWPRPAHGIPGRAREQDLTAMSRRADPGDGMHGQADVAGVGQRGPPAVDADPDPYVDTIGPGACPDGAFDRKGGLQRRRSSNEDGKELVRSCVDLAAASPVHATPDDGTHVSQKGGVAIT